MYFHIQEISYFLLFYGDYPISIEEGWGELATYGEWDIAFGYKAYSGWWSNWSCIIDGRYYKLKNGASDDDSISKEYDIQDFAYRMGNSHGASNVYCHMPKRFHQTHQ